MVDRKGTSPIHFVQKPAHKKRRRKLRGGETHNCWMSKSRTTTRIIYLSVGWNDGSMTPKLIFRLYQVSDNFIGLPGIHHIKACTLDCNMFYLKICFILHLFATESYQFSIPFSVESVSNRFRWIPPPWNRIPDPKKYFKQKGANIQQSEYIEMNYYHYG